MMFLNPQLKIQCLTSNSTLHGTLMADLPFIRASLNHIPNSSFCDREELRMINWIYSLFPNRVGTALFRSVRDDGEKAVSVGSSW